MYLNLIEIVSGHASDIKCLGVINDNYLYTCGRDGLTKAWSIKSDNFLKPIWQSNKKPFYINSLCLLADFVVTGSSEGSVQAFSYTDGSDVFSIKPHKNNICCIVCIGERNQFLTCSWDGSCCLLSNDTVMLRLLGHTEAVLSAEKLNFDNQEFIVTASADKLIKIWEMEKCIHTINIHKACVRKVVYWECKKCILSCDNESNIILWTVKDFSIVARKSHAHSSFIYSLAIIDDYHFLSSGEDANIKLWKLENTQISLVSSIPLPTSTNWDIQVDKINKLVFVADSNGNINIVRIQDSNTSHKSSNSIRNCFSNTFLSEFDIILKETVSLQIGRYPGIRALTTNEIHTVPYFIF